MFSQEKIHTKLLQWLSRKCEIIKQNWWEHCGITELEFWAFEKMYMLLRRWTQSSAWIYWKLGSTLNTTMPNTNRKDRDDIHRK